MKKISAIFVLLLCVVGVGMFLHSNGLFLHEKGTQKSHVAHTVIVHDRPYQSLDNLRKYFGIIGWGGITPVKTFLEQKFGDQILNNLHRIRFDAPGTPEIEIEPDLQYFHPKGGGRYGIKYFYTALYSHAVDKEVLPKSKFHYTFGNKIKWTEEWKKSFLRVLERYKITNVNAIAFAFDTQVTVVVTYVQPKMCPNAEEHDVSLLPWPRRPQDNQVVEFEAIGKCYKHPEGWYYFITGAFFATDPNYIKSYEKYLNLPETQRLEQDSLAFERFRERERNDDFLKAVAAGDLEEVRNFLVQGVDVNPPINAVSDGPLMRAINVNLSVMELLLEYGADVNQTDGTGYAPLHKAVYYSPKDNRYIKALLRAGAVVSAKARDGKQVIHSAARGGLLPLKRSKTFTKAADIVENTGVIPLLVQYGADVNAMAKEGAPLHYAVANQRFEHVKTLLSLGADPNIKNSTRLTALDLAKTIAPAKKSALRWWGGSAHAKKYEKNRVKIIEYLEKHK
jgi:hypothetical protein